MPVSAPAPPIAPATRTLRLHLYGAAAGGVVSAIALLVFTPFALSVRDGRAVPHLAGVVAVIALLVASALVLRRSRVAALALAGYFLVNQIAAAPWRGGADAILAALVLAYLSGGGVWATFTWHHRMAASRRAAPDAPPR